MLNWANDRRPNIFFLDNKRIVYVRLLFIHVLYTLISILPI